MNFYLAADYNNIDSTDMSNELSLNNIQKQVDLWIQTVGVKYFSELTNTVILMEEVGELARIMARKYGEQSWKDTESAMQEQDKMADEMADILWVLICLANQTGVNLTEAFEKNMDKKNRRDSSRHINNPKLM
jgi:NTP pyrophosphatase (non-canonical NTP hydrolase)